jgi:hypothetical protein
MSLSVKNIHDSKKFYESLGFEVYAGDITKNYLIMKNGDTIIGLFQGIFENNIMTFNPGWDQSANPLEDFSDIRTIQQELKNKDVPIINEVDKNSTGPASFMVIDPDGNTILIDQHV